MEEIIKKSNENFICKECGKIFKSAKGLGCHIGTGIHCTTKYYYDKWLKKEKEEYCKICHKETSFINLQKGYRICCSRKCSSILIPYILKNLNQKDIYEKRKQTCLKKYGVENIFQSKEIKEKCEIKHLENYGVKNVSFSDEIKRKKEKTCLKNHGVKYSLQSKNIRNKGKKTCLKKYGVENPTQNIEIFDKAQKSGLKLKQFRDTKIWYQGSYELDFLEKYYDKFINEIKRGKAISYNYKNNIKWYYPDFYIPSLNLIIEIKSSYWHDKFKNIDNAKKKGTLKAGYNYIKITNKNYNIFNQNYI